MQFFFLNSLIKYKGIPLNFELDSFYMEIPLQIFFLNSLKKLQWNSLKIWTRLILYRNSLAIFFYKEILCKNLRDQTSLILLKIRSDTFPNK